MARKYLRISEVTKICCVSEEFIISLERENLIRCVTRKNDKVYSLDQVDRIRVAHNLIGEMEVNLAGVEVALHMREQIIAMHRQIEELFRRVEGRSHKD